MQTFMEESDLEEYVKEDGNYSETEVEDCEALDVQEEESQVNIKKPLSFSLDLQSTPRLRDVRQ